MLNTEVNWGVWAFLITMLLLEVGIVLVQWLIEIFALEVQRILTIAMWKGYSDDQPPVLKSRASRNGRYCVSLNLVLLNTLMVWNRGYFTYKLIYNNRYSCLNWNHERSELKLILLDTPLSFNIDIFEAQFYLILPTLFKDMSKNYLFNLEEIYISTVYIHV
jgi:hypothetical protein